MGCWTSIHNVCRKNVRQSNFRVSGTMVGVSRREFRISRIEFCELPKTISGKVRRVELRKLEEQARASGLPPASERWEEDFPDLQSQPRS